MSEIDLLSGRKDSCLHVLRIVRDQLQSCADVFRYLDIVHLLSFVEENIRILERAKT